MRLWHILGFSGPQAHPEPEAATGSELEQPAMAWLKPYGLFSLPGACTDALARQREAAARLLEVLADLDQAHEEFQQQEQGKVVLGPLRP